MIRSAAWLLALTVAAQAQTPLKSFSYRSTGCTGDLLTWGETDSIRMTEAKPGAGEFPTGNFWVRAVSLTFSGPIGGFAVVGHSGPNGDWISGQVSAGNSGFWAFPADAAPLFSAGEYLDVHAGCRTWTTLYGLIPARAVVTIWYVPAP